MSTEVLKKFAFTLAAVVAGIVLYNKVVAPALDKVAK